MPSQQRRRRDQEGPPRTRGMSRLATASNTRSTAAIGRRVVRRRVSKAVLLSKMSDVGFRLRRPEQRAVQTLTPDTNLQFATHRQRIVQ
jgi:hypothetical protein